MPLNKLLIGPRRCGAWTGTGSGGATGVSTAGGGSGLPFRTGRGRPGGGIIGGGPAEAPGADTGGRSAPLGSRVAGSAADRDGAGAGTGAASTGSGNATSGAVASLPFAFSSGAGALSVRIGGTRRARGLVRAA
jgi:hypothetical protein